MLTGRQQEIWDFLVGYVDRHGYPAAGGYALGVRLSCRGNRIAIAGTPCGSTSCRRCCAGCGGGWSGVRAWGAVKSRRRSGRNQEA